MSSKQSFLESVVEWHAPASEVAYHCPVSNHEFVSSGNICPDCHQPLFDLSHWKWYNSDEGYPFDSS